MAKRRLSVVAAVLPVLALVAVLALLSSHSDSSKGLPVAQVPPARPPLPAGRAPRFTLYHPISPHNQLAVPWGSRSDWIQPWRGYLDTVSAADLLGSIGINFNVDGPTVGVLAKLIHTAGFTRARIEVGWNQLAYSATPRFTPASLLKLANLIETFRKYHIRPLILLNANDQAPTPAQPVTVQVQQSAPVGATSLQLSPSETAAVVPGRTRILEPAAKGAPTDLVQSVASTGLARLTLPLRVAIGAGSLTAQVLQYAPFAPPTLPGGAPNPLFERTMRGWLRYVGLVTSTVKRLLGSTQFDVEVWNELTFGSGFIEPKANYVTGSKRGARLAASAVRAQILDRTVALLRDPRNGVSGIGIGNGFASTTPFGSGANNPAGLTAIDKHPYANLASFPVDAGLAGFGARSVGALGTVDGSLTHSQACGCVRFGQTFTPQYDALLPEYFLTAIQTETLIRDLSPITTYIGLNPHGRHTHQRHAVPPRIWITEVNLSLAAEAKKLGTPLSPAQLRWLQAKAALRYLVSYVNKGVSALDFYALKAGSLSLVDPRLFVNLRAEVRASRAAHRGLNEAELTRLIAATLTTPSLQAAGPSLLGISRVAGAMAGAQPLVHPRQLALTAIGDFQEGFQFTGNGGPNTPTLYNRDVLGFFPFEVSPRRFVIPVYVMTRDMLQVQRPGLSATSVNRYDLVPERFRLTIANLPGCSLTVTAEDPLYGTSVGVHEVSCHDGRLQVDLPVTDYPRLLTISVGGGG